ncbi:uncharacterized protein Dvir_GJ25988 [Drosophila virilis]|uniref:Uncharacterized protein n=1 Tax=Drosophila virilis TaxID=7244 RepID=A0A0Q9WCF2_DROVI|nr:uncharacterized protein LOC26530758 [Drosophila virilis]KRF78507.1 uncharacterized protein Dvir_GJ25988 [Drosophila virilis]
MCCSNDCLENGCCPLDTKALFFGIWTLTHGIFFLVLSIYYFIDPTDCPLYAAIISFMLALVHTVAGILLILGYWKNKGCPFLCGIFMSSIIPYLCLLTIYLPVIQIIFTLTSCMYYRKEMETKAPAK